MFQEFDNFYKCPLHAAKKIGVIPSLFGALGWAVKGAKTLTISVCPFFAARWIGVVPDLSAELGFLFQVDLPRKLKLRNSYSKYNNFIHKKSIFIF